METLVSKWAPESFTGEEAKWRSWSTKFCSFVGSYYAGQVGHWIRYAEEHRDREGGLLNASLPAEAAPASSLLYSALIATCDNKALVIVERCAQGEGVEAWRRLLVHYEPRTNQTKVVRMLALLGWEFKANDLLEQLERFDRACALLEEETKTAVEDSVRIGIVLRGLEPGSLREHLLMNTERHERYSDFRAELDKIVRARAVSMGTAAPMDLSLVGGKGKGKNDKGKAKGKGSKGKGKSKGSGHNHNQHSSHGGSSSNTSGGNNSSSGNGSGKFDGYCNFCGRWGHKQSDCWKKSANKGAKGQGGKGNKVSEVRDDTGEPEAQLSSFALCSLRLDNVDNGPRHSTERREVTWGVDSGACVTVVPRKLMAARGYKQHCDGKTGCTYRTANGNSLSDLGCKYLVDAKDSRDPLVIRARVADVSRPLMSVAALVDAGNQVVFEKDGAYALNPKTGRKIDFERTSGGWNYRMTVAAPVDANRKLQGALASLSSEAADENPFGRLGTSP